MKYNTYAVAILRDDGQVALVDYNPNEWGILRSDDGRTITVITTKEDCAEALIVWQTPNEGETDQQVIQEAIISTVVESWEDD